MSHTLYEVNAFTANGENGNPAGVVLHADDLNEQQMQSIAAQAGFAETAFVSMHEDADRHLQRQATCDKNSMLILERQLYNKKHK